VVVVLTIKMPVGTDNDLRRLREAAIMRGIPTTRLLADELERMLGEGGRGDVSSDAHPQARRR